MISKALAIALLIVTGVAVFLGIKLHAANLRVDAEKAKNTTAQIVNDSHLISIRQLTTRLGELTEGQAMDTAAAEAAAKRYSELEAQYTSLEAENETLRDEMGLKHADTAQWLAAGMDRRVACSLWPGSSACKD